MARGDQIGVACVAGQIRTVPGGLVPGAAMIANRVAGEEHRWPLSPAEAMRIQAQLAQRVRQRHFEGTPRLVAGADCAYDEEAEICATAVVVWDMAGAAPVETETAFTRVRFPYVPGLFAFREAPAILRLLDLLTVRPQLLMCHGHGVAHPRRFGLASHVGVLSAMPTVGVARRALCGSFVEPDRRRGSCSPLTDRGERVGTALRTREGVRPVFVSVGHLVDLAAAERIVLACTPRYRLPEPLRLAHHSAAQALRRASARP